LNKEEISSYYEKYLKALLSGNWAECKDIVQSYLDAKLDPFILYEEVMKKSLYQIGLLWEQNKISVATEHLASMITESVINKVFLEINTTSRIGKKIILACVENEQHQIGLKMVADVFERNGWDSMILGANTPTRDIINIVKLSKPDLLALSVTIFFNIPTLDNMIEKINSEIPNLQIMVGGQAFTRGGFELLMRHKNVAYLNNLFEIEEFIKKES